MDPNVYPLSVIIVCGIIPLGIVLLIGIIWLINRACEWWWFRGTGGGSYDHEEAFANHMGCSRSDFYNVMSTEEECPGCGHVTTVADLTVSGDKCKYCDTNANWRK